MPERSVTVRTLEQIGRVALAAALVTTGLLAVPTRAHASRLDSDRIGGIRLSSGLIAESSAPDVSARSGFLIASTGVSLWNRRLDTRRRMASTTKLMTALLVLENADLDDVVRVSSAASRVPYALGLRTGERRSVRSLLELALVCSSNDAATALAVHVGGSVSGFVTRMNARAAQLGLDDTRYANPHGLDQAGHYTSARDLSTLMVAAMKHKEFRRILRLRAVRLPAYRSRPARTIKATNQLLGEVVGLQGGKTGFTDDARYCFVARASRNGVTLTSVILGASSSRARFRSTKTLFEWGFRHYRTTRLTTAGQTVGSVPIGETGTHRVSARAVDTTSAPTLDLWGPPVMRVSLPQNIAAPVFEGQPLGTVAFIQGSRVLARVEAVASDDCASAEETVGALPVEGYRERTVVVKTAGSGAAVEPFDPTRPLERFVDLPDSVMPPVTAGQQLGAVTYSQDGRAIATVPAVAAETVEVPSLADRAFDWYSRTVRLVAGQ